MTVDQSFYHLPIQDKYELQGYTLVRSVKDLAEYILRNTLIESWLLSFGFPKVSELLLKIQ